MDDSFEEDPFAVAQQELLKAIAASARLVQQTAENGDRDAFSKAGETALRLAGAYHSLMSAAYEIDDGDDQF